MKTFHEHLAAFTVLCSVVIFAFIIAPKFAPSPLSPPELIEWMLTVQSGPLFFTGPFWLAVFISVLVGGFIVIKWSIRSVVETKKREREFRERYS